MIGIPKCVEFNKYMNYYKKKTHLSFYDYQNFLYATSVQFLYPSQQKINISHLYDNWQKQHEVVHMDIEEEKKYMCIDFSLNSIADLIKIADQNPIQENVDYNINLKMIHAIYKELCELDAMIGMQTLKKNVLDQLLYYLQGFHNGVDDYKHTVIMGPPGTGKTEVAKILGTIYSKMGVISKPQDASGTIPFKKATRSDMIAGYLGQTAIKTKALITQCLGGVLFIDEAYSLGNDNFSKECVDTLCEALSDQKDNIMIIIAGYENELNEHFFSLNSGLDSRFVWRFNIDNYVAKDLWEIFKKKVNDCKWKIKNVDGEKWFHKNYEKFSGFGRDIESFLFKVKIAHSKRVYGKPVCDKKVIELVDLNIGYEIFIKNKENTRECSLKKSQKILSSMFV